VDRVRLGFEAGERGARVGEGVDSNSEPRDAVTAEDPDDTEQQDDDHSDGLELQQDSEIENDDYCYECFEDENEFALSDEVGLAGLVNQFRDFPHRLMNRKLLQVSVHCEPEEQPQHANQETPQE